MSIKRLAGQTAIYGISSLMGRLLYFFLTPLYTHVFDRADYGVVTDLFAFIGLAMIFFTYRFETAYFRYATDKQTDQAKKSYDTALVSILLTSLLLGGIIFGYSNTLAGWFQYPEYGYLIAISAGILLLDSLAEIPLSYLRLTNKALKFASIRLIGIGINITLNLFFLLLCPYLLEKGVATEFLQLVYSAEIGIGYIFISNIVASGVVWLLLSPYYFKVQLKFDFQLWKRMLIYSLPLIIVGISYSINELLDRKIMIWLLPGSVEENKSILGAYGAAYKLTMILALFTQAFRYGAEPFFFQQKSESNARETYANVTKYYTIIAIIGCLFTVLYLDVIKYILDEEYWIALGVIPILLLANLANGIYYNLSIWYRLIDKTMIGAWIALTGATATIILNIWWLPIFGYWGSAYATLVCYTLMVVLCYAIGQRYYPVKYDIANFIRHLGVATLLFLFSQASSLWLDLSYWLGLGLNSVLFIGYLTFVYRMERKVLQPIFLRLTRKRK